MTIEQFSNFASTSLLSAVGTGNSSLSVASVSGFPALVAGGQFRICVQDTPVSVPELMLVIGISGNSFTVTRGYEGSTVSAHIAGALISLVITAGIISNIYANGRIVTATSDSFGANDRILEVNQSYGACAIAGPTNPVPWAIEYTLKDGAGNASENPITLTPSGMLIDGLPSLTLNQPWQGITFYFNGTDLRIKS